MTQQARHTGSVDETPWQVGWPADPHDDSSRYSTRVIRAPRIHIDGSVAEDVEDTEAETLWLESWQEHHHRNQQALAPNRNRDATTARPIVRPLGIDAIEQRDKNPDVVDAPTTVLIIPPARQSAVPLELPRVKDNRLLSPRGRTAIGVARTVLISLVLYYVLSSSLQLAGLSGLPLAPFPWKASSGSAQAIVAAAQVRMDGKVASRVRPMTQMRRVDLYDSKAQFDQWGGAACSAASLAEVLTAYGLPNMTIGRIIREMGKDISPNWGLLTYDAFNKVVSKYGLRADVYLSNNPLTYKQMLYLTNTLGIPVLVNMRATTGYYHYLSGGHILVMTGGDNNTIRLTDSSLYYIKYLPLSTYNWMARPRNVVIVPKDYHYTLPR